MSAQVEALQRAVRILMTHREDVDAIAAALASDLDAMIEVVNALDKVDEVAAALNRHLEALP